MTQITINARDGGSFSAYCAMPSSGRGPAVICIQEIFGINKSMRDIADSWAAQGYIAIAPDLFWRQEPGVDITDQTEAEWNKAFALYQGFDVDKGIEDLKATLDHIRGMKECSGKVGTVGFCLGGLLAYLMACRSDADCNVGYYGVGIENKLGESAHLRKPLVLHIAEADKFVPPEAQEKVKQGLADNPNVTIYTYPGLDHAFARIGGQPYNKEAADLANKRTADAFRQALQSL